MTPTTEHQQLILLDHDIATAVESLAKAKRVSKQTVLREAVHTLLVLEGKIPEVFAQRVTQMRNSLMRCDLLLTEALDKNSTADAQRACAEVRAYVSGVLDELGLPHEKRFYNSGAKGRRQPTKGA